MADLRDNPFLQDGPEDHPQPQEYDPPPQEEYKEVREGPRDRAEPMDLERQGIDFGAIDWA